MGKKKSGSQIIAETTPAIIPTTLSVARKFLIENQKDNRRHLDAFLEIIESESTNIGEIILSRDQMKNQLFQYVREETGNLLLHYLCSVQGDEKYSATLSDILKNEDLLYQINQPNIIGHTPLFLAFANRNGLFFTKMAVNKNGISALASILNYLQDYPDIKEFLEFLHSKTPKHPLRILDVIYAENQDQLTLINLLGNLTNVKLIDGITADPINKQVDFFIAEVIKKGTDVNWQDCLQIMLDTINSTDTTKQVREVSLRIFYSFINGLTGHPVDEYLRQKIDSNKITGNDFLMLACKYGNVFVAKSLLEKQDPYPINDFGIEVLLSIADDRVRPVIETYKQAHSEELEEQRRRSEIRANLDAKKLELAQTLERQRIADQKAANVKINLAALNAIVAEKQENGEWQKITINQENFDVCLDGNKIFTLKRKNLEEQSLENGIIKSFNTVIEEKFVAIKKMALREEAEYTRMVSQCSGIGLLISKLEERLQTPIKGKTSSKYQEHAKSNLKILQQLSENADSSDSEQLKKIASVFRECATTLQIKISDSELSDYLEKKREQEVERLQKTERDTLEKAETKSAIDNFYIQITEKLKSDHMLVIGVREEIVDELVEFMFDATKGFIKNEDTHKQRISDLFLEYPTKAWALKAIFNSVVIKLSEKKVVISLSDILESVDDGFVGFTYTDGDIDEDVLQEIESYCQQIDAKPTPPPTQTKRRDIVSSLNPNAPEFTPSQ